MKKNQFTALLLLPALLSFTFVNAQNYEENISEYFRINNSLSKIPAELKEFKILNVDKSKSLNGDVVVINQEIDGIPVFNKSATFLISNNKINYVANGFSNSISLNKIAKNKPSINELNAFTVFANSIRLKDISSYTLDKDDKNKNLLKISKPENIKSNLVYFEKNNEARLAYKISFKEKGTANNWVAIVDALNSEILYRLNTTIFDRFDGNDFLHQNYDDKSAKKTVSFPINQPQKTSNNTISTLASASYNVYQLPIEAPTFGNRTLVEEPFNNDFSPLGWQDTGSSDFDKYKDYTVGNNVSAYSDDTNKNSLDDISQLAYGGPNRKFDFPLDVTKPVDTYKDAAIANLFYVNNMMHNISYQFGFTETARNFQYSNLGKGGVEKDFVLAEARDGGGYDNANFQTAEDGTAPTMQMYLFSPKDYNGITVHSPSDLASFSTTTIFAGDVQNLPTVGVTSDLVIANPLDGCSELTNQDQVKGKIVLIQRGSCNFAQKTNNSIVAGAIGTIYYNAEYTQPVGGYTSGAETVYYSALIDRKSGEILKNKVEQNETVNLTLKKDFSLVAQPDGSLDNGIIAHEYAHGISNRLTGDGNGLCLSPINSNEQMGEGWSDFIALILTMKPTDNANIARGMGTYAYSQDIDGSGIRLAKYSPDFSINNFTYGKTNGMELPVSFFGFTLGSTPNVHSIGFIWATMLWDLTWKYVEKYGYNNIVTADKNSGTAKVLQLVMDGMKLQKCNPSFIDGRDAILAADEAQTGGVDKCMIWNTFAKRGLGVNASPGGLNGYWVDLENNSNPELNDQVEDFSVPSECQLSTDELNISNKLTISPNPAKNEINLNSKNLKGNYSIKIYNMTGSLVKEASYNPANNKSISLSNLTNGVYVIKIEGDNISHSQKLIIKK